MHDAPSGKPLCVPAPELPGGMVRLGPDFSYKQDAAGRGYLAVHLRGNALLRMAATNKVTASTPRERRELGLEGMLPPQVCDLPQQVAPYVLADEAR
jgi:hypothetical protein